MKKALFILMVVLVPVLLFAQPMDTVTIYFETCDGDTATMVPAHTSTLGGGQGDWRIIVLASRMTTGPRTTPRFTSPRPRRIARRCTTRLVTPALVRPPFRCHTAT